MLKIIKVIFIILIIVFLVTFIFNNNEEAASIKFLKWESTLLPIWAHYLSAFLMGIAVWFIISLVGTIQQKTRIHALQKENKKLTVELDRLRNISLDEEIEGTASDQETLPSETSSEQES